MLSTATYRRAGWHPAAMPSTVVAALVANHVYPDPCFGMNLRSYPGMGYNVGQNFANLPIPPESPFARPWWFRTSFALPASAAGRTVWLNFDSINYRANIWLNGRQTAGAEEAAGMYRMFEFDVTKLARPGAENTLAVEVFPPTEKDLGITFVDWNPMPPDKDMGLVRDVYVLLSGPVAVRHAQVLTKLDAARDSARLMVSAELRNTAPRPTAGTLRAKVAGLTLSRAVRLAAGQIARIELEPVELAHPKLWWPYPLGPQNLYHARVEFTAGSDLSDWQEFDFGVRKVASELDAQQHRVFRINGRKILIRGGGWTQDMLLRFSPEREDDELACVRDLHLNTIRLEGKLMNDHFYEACDRKGILVMAGWCCCSYWEKWRDWKPADYAVAGASLRDQLRRLRNHPSILAFLYGSDNSPNPQAEQIYLKQFAEERWPAPAISSAADRTTPGAGATGVKMTGPYDYVAPNYWLGDPGKYGGAWGFNTETSPGPAIPERASLEEMLPKRHFWPIDEFWNFHAGGGGYRNVRIFTAALEARYGKASGLETYVRKSQAMAYEGERAMFEAFGRNKYGSTGVIQWMLNNAWPSIIWHLYDYYLRPGGGYFGAKKACEPLHVQYSYNDRSVAVVNSYCQAFKGYTVSAKVYDLGLAEKFSKTAPVDIAEDSAARVFRIPEISGISTTYFVRLELRNPAGEPVSRNFYWLSTRPDVSNWEASNGRYTPLSSFADFTALESLPRVRLRVSWRAAGQGAEQEERVTVENPGKAVAFFVHLRLMAGDREVAPVRWEDNYFELMPGEARTVTASVHRKDLRGAPARILCDGWNVE